MAQNQDGSSLLLKMTLVMNVHHCANWKRLSSLCLISLSLADLNWIYAIDAFLYYGLVQIIWEIV